MKKMMNLGMIAMAFTSCTTIKSGMSVTDEQTACLLMRRCSQQSTNLQKSLPYLWHRFLANATPQRSGFIRRRGSLRMKVLPSK